MRNRGVSDARACRHGVRGRVVLAAVSSPAALGEAGPRDLRGTGSGLAAGFVPFVARRGERGVYLVQLRTPSLAARIATAKRALGPTVERETVARILSSQRPRSPSQQRSVARSGIASHVP